VAELISTVDALLFVLISIIAVAVAGILVFFFRPHCWVPNETAGHCQV
jgi:hypothetical protein